MPVTRQLVGGILGLALLGCGACTLAVCSAIGPRTETVDPTVRAPQAPAAQVAALPGWRGVRTDTLSDTRFRSHPGSVGPVAIRETGDELVLRAVRVARDTADLPLPALRIGLKTGGVAAADSAVWEAAGPTTTLCAGTWGGADERVDGDPWDTEASRTPFPYVPWTDTLAVSAGAHVLSMALSADSSALAVFSGAGPRTETRVIMGGWEDVEGPRYLEVFSTRDATRLAGPVQLPPDEEPARMDRPRPCWSPSDRAVVLPFRPGSLDPGPMRLAVLDLRE